MFLKKDDIRDHFMVTFYNVFNCIKKNLGLELAELTTLPEVVVKNARGLAERLRAKAIDIENSQTTPELAEMVRRKKLSSLAYRLIDIIKNASIINENVLVAQLKYLQVTEASNNLF